MGKKIVRVLALMLLMVSYVTGALSAAPLIVQSPWFIQTNDRTAAQSVVSIQEVSLAGQLGVSDQQSPVFSKEDRVLSAISNPAYPVTPGDMLTLSYTEGKTLVSLTLRVGGDNRLSIPNFGTVDGIGKTLEQFVKDIEQTVTTYLPFSSPRVSLLSTGAFTVLVKGEVSAATEVSAWGLSRLAEVVGLATSFASARNVEILSSSGKRTTYDLYKALREGDITQNPLIRPGDVVTFSRANRIVVLSGEVLRPGIYQPLQQETLSDVINTYGGGILPNGDASSIVVERAGSMEVSKVDLATQKSFALRHMDVVRVEPVMRSTASVIVEGAISVVDGQSVSTIPASSGRLYYQFYPNETVDSMILALADRFTTTSDLLNAYIQRGPDIIAIDAQSILIGSAKEETALLLHPGDKFVVPFNQMFVTVAGGVLKPGVYPYVPNKEASYYINLAGGFDKTKNRNSKYAILDKFGEKVDKNAVILPENIITAEMNTFNAINGQTLATTVTIVGLVATILSIVIDVITISSKL